MTLTIKQQIDGLRAYGEYQEAQIEALRKRFPGVSPGWVSEEVFTCAYNARRARVEASNLEAAGEN